MGQQNCLQLANKILNELFAVHDITNGKQNSKPIDRFKIINKDDFEKRKNKLLSTINEHTTEIEFTATMKKIFALFKDAHTNFLGKMTNGEGASLENQFSSNFNATFKIFDNKVYVFNADKEYLQVSTINGVPIEKICSDLTEIISYEIAPWRNLQMEGMLGQVSSYQMIKAGNKNGQVLTIDGIDKNSNKQTIIVGRQELNNQQHGSGMVRARENQQTSTNKRTAANGRKSPFYDFKLSADGKLYIDYSACQNDKQYPIGSFFDTEIGGTFIDDIKATIGDKQITGVVIDLRQNTGGNSELIKPLLAFLKQYQLGKDNVAVLGGAGTFSSGVWAVQSIKNSFGAKFIGETLGQPARRYGQAPWKMVDGYSFTATEKFFDMSKTFGTTGVINPDIEVKQTLADYINGNDRQLAVAREQISKKTINNVF